MEFKSLYDYLEISTIHGLSYISKTKRKNVKLFWICIVISAFFGAFMSIHYSFKSWNESPVKTIIESRSIKQITFPKVTVCPPKNTHTDLNYDLLMAQNMTVDDETRNELRYYAEELLTGEFFCFLFFYSYFVIYRFCL